VPSIQGGGALFAETCGFWDVRQGVADTFHSRKKPQFRDDVNGLPIF
jgi:hypothetical protein